MSTGIKNGKLRTNDIYTIKLIFIFFAVLLFHNSLFAVDNAKEWIIVIDAGHGGKDPGSIGSNSYEKNITLAIALKTGEYIKQNIKNVKVIYTREKDIKVDLADRPKIANKNNADLFISIHANGFPNKNVRGAEIFVMGHSKDKENLEVAMRENEVIYLENDYTTKYEGFDPKSPDSYIMFTLMQNVFLEQSTNLASKIQKQFTERLERNDRGVKQAGFWVLYTTTMPSVLVETGFITNLSDEKYLNSKQGQDYLASAIFRACKDYIDEINNKSGLSYPDSGTVISAPLAEDNTKIIFKIQIITSATKIDLKPENFKGLTDVTEINLDDRFKYATGSFKDYSSAVSFRKKIESTYPDAFVIAVKHNKILPLQQALEEEKKK